MMSSREFAEEIAATQVFDKAEVVLSGAGDADALTLLRFCRSELRVSMRGALGLASHRRQRKAMARLVSVLAELSGVPVPTFDSDGKRLKR
jgi:hypothetical protein